MEEWAVPIRIVTIMEWLADRRHEPRLDRWVTITPDMKEHFECRWCGERVTR